MDNPSPGFRSNPSHHITVEPFDGVVTVHFSSAVIASTKNAKVLKEAGHSDVLYIPFEDIYFDFLRRSETSTHCPFKRDASYWSVIAAGEARPISCGPMSYDEMLIIRDHGAFYPEKVSIEATAAAATDRPIP